MLKNSKNSNLEVILKLKTPEDCSVFAINALDRNRPDLALAARKRSIELRAISKGAKSDVERECLEAVFAYEEVLSARNNKKTRATRTWQMIARHGIVESVERAVSRKDETFGFNALKELGLEEYAFESVVLRNLEIFTLNAVQRSRDRLKLNI
jgi:hypothetical protein